MSDECPFATQLDHWQAIISQGSEGEALYTIRYHEGAPTSLSYAEEGVIRIPLSRPSTLPGASHDGQHCNIIGPPHYTTALSPAQREGADVVCTGFRLVESLRRSRTVFDLEFADVLLWTTMHRLAELHIVIKVRIDSPLKDRERNQVCRLVKRNAYAACRACPLAKGAP